jgi:hypothetical protein
MTMKAVIFLGPSLPVDEARKVLGDAIYLPPARQSDLLSAATRYRPDVIGLVDGEFGQALSVWHKEILFALERGIRVFGASSMGALRAAETDVYGMVGVGEVYRMYASGEINDDDEVALAHGLDEVGYRGLSEPMVNIRATFRRALAEAVVTQPEHDALVAEAKAMFFPERTFPRILRAAGQAGMEPATLERVKAWVKTGYVDQKRQDAVLLLETIRDLDFSAPAAPPVKLARTNLFETLYQRDRSVGVDGTDVPLSAISDYAALHMPGFAELNSAALNRALVGVLADFLEVQPTDEETDAEAERFRFGRRLSSPAAFAAWLERNHLDEGEFRALMREMAQVRALQRWLITRRFMERTSKLVLDELRLRGQYEDAAAKAAAQERVLAENYQYFRETSFHELSTRDLVVDHLRSTPCRMDTHYAHWSEEAGFHRVEDLRVQLLRAKLAREFVNGEVARALATTGAAEGSQP